MENTDVDLRVERDHDGRTQRFVYNLHVAVCVRVKTAIAKWKQALFCNLAVLLSLIVLVVVGLLFALKMSDGDRERACREKT